MASHYHPCSVWAPCYEREYRRRRWSRDNARKFMLEYFAQNPQGAGRLYRWAKARAKAQP